MYTDEVKTQHYAWVLALFNGYEPSVCDLDSVHFGLSFSKDRLEAMLVGIDYDATLKENKVG